MALTYLQSKQLLPAAMSMRMDNRSNRSGTCDAKNEIFQDGVYTLCVTGSCRPFNTEHVT